MGGSRIGALGAALLALLAGACADPEVARTGWVGLAAEGGPEVTWSVAARGWPFEDAAGVRLEHRDGAAWLVWAIEPSAWIATAPGIWSTPLPAGHASLDGVSETLTDGSQAFAPYTAAGSTPGRVPPGRFLRWDRRLYVSLPPGAPPPSAALYAWCTRSPHAGGPHEVRGAHHSGLGWSVHAGEAVEIVLDAGGPPTLRFATTWSPLSGRNGSTACFQVLLDERLLLETREPLHAPGVRWHALPLGDGLESGAKLRFEVTGDLAETAFLAPTLGPEAPPPPVARTGTRPDVVVLLADTFRADNLALHGGDHVPTPFLDGLAARARTFERAWSTSTFTLPAQASLFTGLFPRQAGVHQTERALADELVSFVEVLAAAGYRTGAVTDGGIVSARFGFAQGFEFFHESRVSLDDTLARAEAFLDADDGRPTLLFVHTYHTHTPYTPSDTSLDLVGPTRAFDEVAAQAVEFFGLRSPEAGGDLDPELAASPTGRTLLEELRRLYLATVIDLDRGAERLHASLEARGHLANGAFLFTSDHGEAFGEHDFLYHHGETWEQQLRVPLLLAGGAVPPARVGYAASLVDVAPTVAHLAGLEAPPSWLGRSLLELDRERPIFAFHAAATSGSTWSVCEGDRKVFGLEHHAETPRGPLFGAFDLAADPGELDDLSAQPWATALRDRHAAAVEVLLAPLHASEAVQLSAEKAAELRALGYLGD